MAQAPSDPQAGAYDSLVYIALAIAAMWGAEWAYGHWRTEINAVLMAFNRPFVWLGAHVPYLSEGSMAAKIYPKVDWSDPGRYGWDHMAALASAAGRWLRWPLAALMGYLAWRMWTGTGVESIYTRIFNMQRLIQNNVREFPCMAPVAYRNLLDEPMDKGPWMAARTTLQWCAENGLLLDGNGSPVRKDWLLGAGGMARKDSPLLEPSGNDGVRFDREAAARLLEGQLGPRFEGYGTLPAHLKGLAAALAAHAAGDKKAAQALLDRMSLSFREATPKSPMVLDISGADALAAKYLGSKEVLGATRFQCSYVTTWLMALLDFQSGGARAKGVVACSQFIWLRPADRTAFYALNQVGGRRPWIEAAGPWAHFRLQEAARVPVAEPDFGGLLDDIERELTEIGIIG